MRNVNLLIGLTLLNFYACIVTIKAQNRCVHCNFEACHGPNNEHSGDWNLVVNHMNEKVYDEDVRDCVPLGYNITGTIDTYICFPMPFCAMAMAKNNHANVEKNCDACHEFCHCAHPKKGKKNTYNFSSPAVTLSYFIKVIIYSEIWLNAKFIYL